MRYLPIIYFFVTVLCLRSVTVYATEFTAGGFFGVGQLDLKGDKPSGGSYETRFSPVVGLEAAIFIKPDIELAIQPHFVRRGAVVEFRDSQRQKTGPDVDLRFDYLEMPVVVRFLGKTNVKPYALGGLSLGVLLKAERQVEGQSAVDMRDEIEKLDINAIFGVGVLFPVRRFFLFGELRYTQGLQNVTVKGVDQDDPEADVRLKNVGTQLLGGILLPMGSP